MKQNRASEKWLERAVLDFVTGCGGAAIKVTASTINGLSDRFVLWPGGVAEFVEIKSTGKTPSPIQQTVRKELIELGFRYTVIDSETTLQHWQNLHHDRTRPK